MRYPIQTGRIPPPTLGHFTHRHHCPFFESHYHAYPAQVQ